MEIPALACSYAEVCGCLRRAAGERSEALERLCSYDWPGNIRELSNALSQASVYSQGEAIALHHLPDRVRMGGMASEREQGGRVDRERRSRGRYTAPPDAGRERELIMHTLEAEGENRTRAAERLGMCRATLWMKLKQYGIA